LSAFCHVAFWQFGADHEKRVDDDWRNPELSGVVARGVQHNRSRTSAKDARSVAERHAGYNSRCRLVVHRSSFHSRGADPDMAWDSALGNHVLRLLSGPALPRFFLSTGSRVPARKKLE